MKIRLKDFARKKTTDQAINAWSAAYTTCLLLVKVERIKQIVETPAGSSAHRDFALATVGLWVLSRLVLVIVPRLQLRSMNLMMET